MSDYNLAQVNIAKMLAPMDDTIMQNFVNNLDRINEIAEQAEGFIWRLKDGEDYEKAAEVFKDETLIVNMSVWTDMDSLFNYVYKSGHIEVFKRKKEWFSKLKMMHMVFWFVQAGHTPTPEEAKACLNYINTHGETPYAFTFKSKFISNEFLAYKKIA